MPRNRLSLKSPRAKAFKLQNGVCYYCKLPMWNESPDEFAKRNRIKPGNLRHFQCTGEHLRPHSEGGTSRHENIVAAHAFCNRWRHRGKKRVPSPEEYGLHVWEKVQQGRWQLQQLLRRQ